MIVKVNLVEGGGFDFKIAEGVTFETFCKQLSDRGGLLTHDTKLNSIFYPLHMIKTIHIASKKGG